MCAVSCGGAHTACVTLGGRAYAWGSEGRGRLGQTPTRSGEAWLPVALEMPEGRGEGGFGGVACGYEHTAVMWVMGGGGHGERGRMMEGLCMGVRALRAMVRIFTVSRTRRGERCSISGRGAAGMRGSDD